MTTVPPIKSQGIKTKLVGWINDCTVGVDYDRWIEPFMGTGVVAFNIRPQKALMCDRNPHLIAFYKAIQDREITAKRTRQFLTMEGKKLLETGGEYYYTVRDRFNLQGDPLDFLFLSRACFNGMMRFNKSGGFNVPFCRKPNRFSKALVTKISNQVQAVSNIILESSYEFKHQDFEVTLSEVKANDLVYCDPPYIGRHVDYFDSWSGFDERRLHNILTCGKIQFIMSTWVRNRYRTNDYVSLLWSEYSIFMKEHFYHVGANESNRNAMIEALLTNLPIANSDSLGAKSSLLCDGAFNAQLHLPIS